MSDARWISSRRNADSARVIFSRCRNSILDRTGSMCVDAVQLLNAWSHLLITHRCTNDRRRPILHPDRRELLCQSLQERSDRIPIRSNRKATSITNDRSLGCRHFTARCNDSTPLPISLPRMRTSIENSVPFTNWYRSIMYAFFTHTSKILDIHIDHVALWFAVLSTEFQRRCIQWHARREESESYAGKRFRIIRDRSRPVVPANPLL